MFSPSKIQEGGEVMVEQEIADRLFTRKFSECVYAVGLVATTRASSTVLV